jgi:hypothetical protein
MELPSVRPTLEIQAFDKTVSDCRLPGKFRFDETVGDYRL